jgi:hypothetical protein
MIAARQHDVSGRWHSTRRVVGSGPWGWVGEVGVGGMVWRGDGLYPLVKFCDHGGEEV